MVKQKSKQTALLYLENSRIYFVIKEKFIFKIQ